MEITCTTVQSRIPVTIMRLKGKLDSGSAGYFDEQARQVIDLGCADILLDFSEVPFVSSVGIRSLSAIYDWLHPVKSADEHRLVSQGIHDGSYHAPHLKLLNLNPSVRKTLDLAALDRYLEIFSDENQALKAF